LLAISAIHPAHAGVLTTYDDVTTFTADIAGMDATTCDFDSSTVGDVINDGGSLCNITFNYDIAGLPLTVNTGFETTSGFNYLGVDDDDFLLGDSFELAFTETIYALGLYIIAAPDESFDGDFALEVFGGSAFSTGTLFETLEDGSLAYYLGIQDTDGFNSVNFYTYDCGCLAFGIDDITYATNAASVPSPASSTLFMLGFLALCLARKIKPRPVTQALFSRGLNTNNSNMLTA